MVMTGPERAIMFAAGEWWRMKRPEAWSEPKHMANPFVNLTTDSERFLADALVRYYRYNRAARVAASAVDCPICRGESKREEGEHEREFRGVTVKVKERWMHCTKCGEEYVDDQMAHANEWAMVNAVIEHLQTQLYDCQRRASA